MTREEAIKTLKDRIEQYTGGVHPGEREILLEAFAALREKQQRERGWGCAYCVIGRRSPDARYCSNCGRKLTPALPELANESVKVNHEPKLASETAEICTLRCDYCGKYAKESDLTTEYTKDKYLICRRCKENA